MKRLRIIFLLLCAVTLAAACTKPNAYTIRGTLYTDATLSTPIQGDTLFFNYGNSVSVGYAVTDSQGRFAILFWSDGLGNEQPAPKSTYESDCVYAFYKGEPVFKQYLLYLGSDVEGLQIYPGWIEDNFAFEKGGEK